jgi:hypothetical protein
MEVKMLNRLTGIGSAVRNNPVSAGKVFLRSYGTDGAEALRQIPVFSAIRIIK